MTTDDRRMHEGDTPGMGERRGPERHEDPVTDADAIGTEAPPPAQGATEDVEDVGSTTDREQDSALGGHVGTRSTGG